MIFTTRLTSHLTEGQDYDMAAADQQARANLNTKFEVVLPPWEATPPLRIINLQAKTVQKPILKRLRAFLQWISPQTSQPFNKARIVDPEVSAHRLPAAEHLCNQHLSLPTVQSRQIWLPTPRTPEHWLGNCPNEDLDIGLLSSKLEDFREKKIPRYRLNLRSRIRNSWYARKASAIFDEIDREGRAEQDFLDSRAQYAHPVQAPDHIALRRSHALQPPKISRKPIRSSSAEPQRRQFSRIRTGQAGTDHDDKSDTDQVQLGFSESAYPTTVNSECGIQSRRPSGVAGIIAPRNSYDSQGSLFLPHSANSLSPPQNHRLLSVNGDAKSGGGTALSDEQSNSETSEFPSRSMFDSEFLPTLDSPILDLPSPLPTPQPSPSSCPDSPRPTPSGGHSPILHLRGGFDPDVDRVSRFAWYIVGGNPCSPPTYTNLLRMSRERVAKGKKLEQEAKEREVARRAEWARLEIERERLREDMRRNRFTLGNGLGRLFGGQRRRRGGPIAAVEPIDGGGDAVPNPPVPVDAPPPADPPAPPEDPPVPAPAPLPAPAPAPAPIDPPAPPANPPVPRDPPQPQGDHAELPEDDPAPNPPNPEEVYAEAVQIGLDILERHFVLPPDPIYLQERAMRLGMEVLFARVQARAANHAAEQLQGNGNNGGDHVAEHRGPVDVNFNPVNRGFQGQGLRLGPGGGQGVRGRQGWAGNNGNRNGMPNERARRWNGNGDENENWNMNDGVRWGKLPFIE